MAGVERRRRRPARAASDANLKAVRYVLDGHRARHGWHPGWVWEPSAWQPGQDCGCKGRPCGRYVNPVADRRDRGPL